WGAGPEIFNPENSRTYGRYVGRRYANKPIVWILGGDRPIETEVHREIIRAMALGIKEGDGGRNLITFHPMGGQGSAESLHEERWLDFNMVQTGHSRNSENHRAITADYNRTPIKPCMDAEPGYEDHAAGFKIENGYLDDYDARKAAYWSLFAGSHGHTYGCHPVWQFLAAGREAVTFARRPWYEAIHLPGAGQMQHARALLLSRPFLTRIPDQSLIVSDPGAGVHHLRATRDQDRTYALTYVPTPQKVTLDTGKLAASTLSAHWYDPRTGTSRLEGIVPRGGPVEFITPQGGPDWVLVLDNPECRYPPPGMAVWPGPEATRGRPPE
ncbi:MAG: glycoside hydrolase family 140 protein, partial [Chloroflexi bacterium]|nr:glycoside hydrolase family 140 protein [Chloroflexota bacterium]